MTKIADILDRAWKDKKLSGSAIDAKLPGMWMCVGVKEAFDWCKFLANTPVPSGETTLIITNGGGIGVMAADACEKYGVRLYDDARALKETFSKVTPDFGSTKNPVDLTGQATSGLTSGSRAPAAGTPSTCFRSVRRS